MINLIISTIAAIIIPILVYLVAWILSIRTNQRATEKLSPFECGFDPNHRARIPFSIRFFLLAIIFIVFDIEIVLLIPVPLLFYTTSYTYLLIGRTLFLIILLLGLIHEWNQGSLDWSN